MALPHSIRVKLTSEDAGAISLNQVVVEELRLRELIEHMLAIAGKNQPRIREMLLRGTVVSGASRFRWASIDPDPEDLRQLLATFPDPEPGRPFEQARCVRAVLRGGRYHIDVAREAAASKSWFRRASFWDELMDVTGGSPPAYVGYSYRDRADQYRRAFTPPEIERLRQAAARVRFSTLRRQIGSVAFVEAELYAGREVQAGS